MKFTVFQVSRKGGREKNEDRMGYAYTREAGLFALADGMGGHPEGEVAAQMALQTVSALFQRHARPMLDDVRGFLAEAVMAAHRALLQYAAARGMLDSPRTTLVVAVLQDGRATWVHCGDSRLYLTRGSDLLVRTRDHSYAEHPEIGSSPASANRNVLFTCLGSPARPLFDVAGPVELQSGDRLLLCSDGLWSMLNEREIVDVVGDQPVSESVPELVERALRAAGRSSDNVTAVAVEWDAPEFELTRGVSTDSIGNGVFASTIQAGMPDGPGDAADDLDDEAIERSIAEINEAIRRSAQRKP
ncbi:protein phosphatase 2C domain-containing protein [uncultured Xylophilus sp.]|uniref:PP2C family protein-serine/threonine phosphatase n=1 Tax=uncultured Xylophilus sp. TaxID=296832 RepID=UPI0025D42B7A|nr:protein phosphatase 2C domain-containing protein [uncultured Xylophilus sp.]